MSSSVSNHMLEDNIPSANDDEFSGYEEPLESERSPACKSKKQKKHDNPSIVWDHFEVETTENSNFTHRIDKDHSEGTNTNDSIIKAIHIITKRRQEKIAQLLVEFIIEDCQPFHILQSKAFCRLLNYMEAGFQIPCEKT
ncbi:10991_t:CDS:2, partial [Racocetra persica]